MLRERDNWGDPEVDGRIILRWIFTKWEGVVGTGWIWLRIGTGGGRLWVALRVTGVLKPPHHDKVEPQTSLQTCK